MKKILFIGSEAMPFAATGGLGDVLGSLPAAIAAEAGSEADVRVVLPLYGAVSQEWRSRMTVVAEYELSLAWRRQYCGIRSLVKDGVTYYFINNEYYFRRSSLYGEYDDGERFAFFCKAAIDMLGVIGFYPDIIHAHDWQAALSLIYLDRKYRGYRGYENIRTVFTIHNIEYQGKYDFAILGDVFDLGEDSRHIVEYENCINLMKGAIVCANEVSTVSPRYAQEICGAEHGQGLDPVLRENAGKLCGILNGIDYQYYNPAKDKAIAANYSWRTLDRKYQNKTALQQELELPERQEAPLIAVISRLAAHKGLDLISEMIYRLLAEQDVQFVVLGKGEGSYENFFRELSDTFPGKAKALITYDRELSKRIYAAADIFLMPSRSEPCGLSQMIASRYGAIPVVRETGGLYDSIKGYWEDDGKMMGNGFTFAGYRADELMERTCAAIALWRNEDKRRRFVGKIMRTDFSWKASAKQYLEMYRSICD